MARHIQCGSFNPVEYEAYFGEGGKYPPIIIELDSGEKFLPAG